MNAEGKERPESHKRSSFLLPDYTVLSNKTYDLTNNANVSYNLICMYMQHFYIPI